MTPHTESSRRTSRARAVFVALLSGYAAGCAGPDVEVDPETAAGEAVLAALEHVAALKWEQPGTTIIKGKLAVAHQGEEPLAESTRVFLDDAFEERGWRWSTEEPLVPTGNCSFPGGDCRLKDLAELHLTFSVWPRSREADHAGGSSEPWLDRLAVWPLARREGFKVHVTWLNGISLPDGHIAELGGEELSVTYRGAAWEVRTVMSWIT